VSDARRKPRNSAPRILRKVRLRLKKSTLQATRLDLLFQSGNISGDKNWPVASLFPNYSIIARIMASGEAFGPTANQSVS